MGANQNICIVELAADQNIWLVAQEAFQLAAEITFSSRKLQSYIGAKVIFSGGDLMEIVSIHKMSLAGNSPVEKFESFLTGTYKINVAFELKDKLDIEGVKQFVTANLLGYRKNYRYGHFFMVDDDVDVAIEKILFSVKNAKTYDDVISAFGYSDADGGCLAML